MTTIGSRSPFDAPLMERKGTPRLIADLLRQRIIEGELKAGARLRVEHVSKSLNVSANTVREALQLLERERLVIQQLNRGIFVRTLGRSDVRDLYMMRRLLELGALSMTHAVDETALTALSDAVEFGKNALSNEDWIAAGNATTLFHQGIASLAMSARVTEATRVLMAEFRLALAPLENHTNVHRVFVAQHEVIFWAIRDGDLAAATQALADYLDQGEQALLDLFDAEDDDDAAR